MGYDVCFPLAQWERTVYSTSEVGIAPPIIYEVRNHANCWGCLKGGRLHWFVTYVHRRDIFDRARLSESRIGYTILKECSLAQIEPLFAAMVQYGIEANELTLPATFWANVRKRLGQLYYQLRPTKVSDKDEFISCEVELC